MPCNRSPWGRSFAIHVNTCDIAWQSTLGLTDSVPAEKQNTGGAESGGGHGNGRGPGVYRGDR
jgi:quinoprotein glucose dehydrogenase